MERQENEIPAAIRMVQCLDLRNKIITGDALLAQRGLSAQIAERGGEYVWTVKENQPQLQQDIAASFGPESCTPAFSPCQKDFAMATSREKGHGRLEQRTLTTSSMLQGYVNWPYAQQVFRLERRFVRASDGLVMEETTYSVTSLTAQKAYVDTRRFRPGLDCRLQLSLLRRAEDRGGTTRLLKGQTRRTFLLEVFDPVTNRVHIPLQGFADLCGGPTSGQ